MRPPRASVLCPLAVALLSLAGPRAVEGSPAEGPHWTWERSRLFPGVGEASALAFDPGTGRLAVGDEGGVWLCEGEAGATRVLRRGPVRDLAFSEGGAFYAATDRGLFHVDAAGDASSRSLGAGAGAVLRVLVGPDLILAGAEAGAFLSGDGRRWAPLDAGLPGGAVAALALRPRPAGSDLWLAVDGEVYRVTLHSGGDRPVLEGLERVLLPGGRGRRDAVDLSTSIPGAGIAVLGRRGLWLEKEGSWERFQPTYPPGASPIRFGWTAGRLWIATDRGLLEASTASGPWHRTSPPVGSTAISEVGGVPQLVFAAGARGVFTGRSRVRPSAAFSPPPAPDAREPTARQVQVAAIRYLDLGPERIRALQRGVRRRGWLPRLELRGSYGGWDAWQRDWDEAFSYGADRLFLDRESERNRDFGFSTALVWDLADLAYHPESLDVSKEAREVIELRDDVLDEVTQLYFERRRALLELASDASLPAAEAARLRLRADELGSGLDAWTGGWWSRAASAHSPHSPRDDTQENHP